MELQAFEKIDDFCWRIPPVGPMRVPALLFASEALIAQMHEKVRTQICNVAALPGIVDAAYAMPDAHWGYGFPIGGVAAFDADEGGVISAGGVGFDISCGVRLLKTGLTKDTIEAKKRKLADALFASIPAGVGSKSELRFSESELDEMLHGGARWAVGRGFGHMEDLERIEEGGKMKGAKPEEVSAEAKRRQAPEMGTLGSGNHYLEVQEVDEVFDPAVADAFGLHLGDTVVSIHCGSRGLGHQIGTEFLRTMLDEAPKHGIELPDRELACVPLRSELGIRYLGAMRAAINCALANRQIVAHFCRQTFQEIFSVDPTLLYDVSHNTCKEEEHWIRGRSRNLFVHRKGATRAFGPGHPSLSESFQKTGQPVIIGGSMGTESYVLVGTKESERKALSSACHGAGRAVSRTQALKRWRGRQVVDALAERGILIRSISSRGVAEEAPGAYKDVTAVVDSAHAAGLAKKVVRLTPLICVKG